jgi:hypothetical protein
VDTSSKPWIVVRRSPDRVEVGFSPLWTGAIAASFSAAVMLGALLSTIKETAPFSLRAAIASGIGGSIITSIAIALVAQRTVLRADDSGLLVPSPRRLFDWHGIRELRWAADLDVLWIIAADGTEHRADLSIFGSATGRRGVEELIRSAATRGVPVTSIDPPAVATGRLPTYEVLLDTRGYRGWAVLLAAGSAGMLVIAFVAVLERAPWAGLFCGAFAGACLIAAVHARRWSRHPPVLYRVSSEGLWASGLRVEDRLRAWWRRGRRGFIYWSELARVRSARFPNGPVLWFRSRNRDEKPIVLDLFETTISPREFLAECRARAGAAVDAEWPTDEQIAPARWTSMASTRWPKSD